MIDESKRQMVGDELVRTSITPLERERLERLVDCRVTPEKQLPPMEALFRLFDVPCFYRGELVAVTGKAKSGKTLFLSMLMAACLTQRSSSAGLLREDGKKVLALERHTDNTECTEKDGHTDLTDRASPLKVLWIDTEQSQQSTQDIMVNRILPMARGQTDAEEGDTPLNQRLFAYNLRGMGYEVRRELMDAAIGEVRPDLVIVDGIKDLMTDINDAQQATILMEHLMSLAQRHHCSLVCVLHQNKSDADQNMRGSIGTELTNKAFEVYSCEYLEERARFKVKQRLSRRERIREKLYYMLDGKGLPVVCEMQEQPRDAQGRWVSTKAADLRKLFTEAFEGRTSRPYGHLMAAAMRIGDTQDKQDYYDWFKEAVELGIIKEETHPEKNETWVRLLQDQLPF